MKSRADGFMPPWLLATMVFLILGGVAIALGVHLTTTPHLVVPEGFAATSTAAASTTPEATTSVR